MKNEHFTRRPRAPGLSPTLLNVNPHCESAIASPPFTPQNLREAVSERICPPCSHCNCVDKWLFTLDVDGHRHDAASEPSGQRICLGCGEGCRSSETQVCRCCGDTYVICDDCRNWSELPPDILGSIIDVFSPTTYLTVSERQAVVAHRLTELLR